MPSPKTKMRTSIYIETALIERIEEMADRESRSVSNMAGLLLEWALDQNSAAPERDGAAETTKQSTTE